MKPPKKQEKENVTKKAEEPKKANFKLLAQQIKKSLENDQKYNTLLGRKMTIFN